MLLVKTNTFDFKVRLTFSYLLSANYVHVLQPMNGCILERRKSCLSRNKAVSEIYLQCNTALKAEGTNLPLLLFIQL